MQKNNVSHLIDLFITSFNQNRNIICVYLYRNVKQFSKPFQSLVLTPANQRSPLQTELGHSKKNTCRHVLTFNTRYIHTYTVYITISLKYKFLCCTSIISKLSIFMHLRDNRRCF